MNNTKILCVDDEPALVDLISEIVSHLGFEVLTALNAEDAFEIVERESARLALVLSDHSMPGKSGFELRQMMLENHKQVPFVLVSGQVSRETALEAIELKISGFLAKPFQRRDLEQMIAAQSKDRVASILEEDELREGFVNDAEMLINEMENLLLALENDLESTEGLDRLFACAHTIKGASGFFKPNTIHQFVHRFEDYLSPFKKGEHPLDATGVQTLLSGLDTIKELIRALAEQTTPPQLETLVKVFEVDREKSAAPAGEVKTRTETAPGPKAQKAEDEIRVPINVLNEFMETSGEITVLRNMVNKVLQGMEVTRGDDANVAMLTELMSEMHKSISFMQDKIEDLKKVPVSHLVRPLNRTLRDLCGSLRKQIQLGIDGEQLRVDHHLAEVLGKCLIHLLRNAADHGIEAPEARVAAGKAEQGHLQIAFSETTEQVLVRITDDGKGIDAARIKQKALEKQLITPEEAARKTDDEIRLLIFEAGFSTAEQVSDVSGRGVGMDMVRQTIADAGGRVELKSVVGQGTELTLRLPVPKSVMIINALLIRFKDQTYALPQDSVDRIVTLEEPGVFERLKMIGDVVFGESQGRLDPILGLGELFGGSTLR